MILIEWFAPGYKAGGPIQSCVNLCIALKESYDMYVLTTDTDHGETAPYPEIMPDQWVIEQTTGASVYYAKKKALGPGRLSKLINEVNADFIYLNLLFSPRFVLFPLWLKFSGKIKSTVILCPRGTLYDSAISLKSYKKKPLLLLLRWLGGHRQITFHATNKREEKAILQYFPGSKIIIADNLPNTLQPAFTTCSKTTGDLRCIFIARIVPIKNIGFLLGLLAVVQNAITITIIGPIENEDYWAACKKIIQSLPQNIAVNYIGPRQNNELLPLLRQHHLFVLPTTGENFGHAIFESLLAGRPVLISDQTPWLNLEENEAGWALPLDKPQIFVDTINKLADCNQHQFDKYAQSAWDYANKFIHDPRLTGQYKTLFD